MNVDLGIACEQQTYLRSSLLSLLPSRGEQPPTQAFLGRDEKRAPLKTPAWERRGREATTGNRSVVRRLTFGQKYQLLEIQNLESPSFAFTPVRYKPCSINTNRSNHKVPKLWRRCGLGYPGCLRLFYRGFRFLSSLYSDRSWLRPLANTENVRRTREKPLVPGVGLGHHIRSYMK